MSRFEIGSCRLQGLAVVTRMRIEDQRGFLSRLYCTDEMSMLGLSGAVRQVNQTLTRKRGAIRGMHYQRAPHSEMKLVSVLHGEIFDVAVDLRAGSATFLQWHAEVLSSTNMRSLFIPKGFAHGYQTLTDDCELLYLHSERHIPEAEAGVNPRDPALMISWPLEITEISARDASHAMLSSAFSGMSP
jgi:dTDP-4-dehydrorhamnose 3,5-epimerase